MQETAIVLSVIRSRRLSGSTEGDGVRYAAASNGGGEIRLQEGREQRQCGLEFK
ncbi:hypothetical protein AWENTII_006030 [Aspergillus wentii]